LAAIGILLSICDLGEANKVNAVDANEDEVAKGWAEGGAAKNAFQLQSPMTCASMTS
jgi:hypothetical protein